MADKQATEGIDLEAAYQDKNPEDAEPEAEKEPDESEAEKGKESDDGEKKDGGNSDGDDDGDGLGDLMDIFSDESDVTDSDAGLYDEFLEELTMDQVSEEAERLLEEFRAI